MSLWAFSHYSGGFMAESEEWTCKNDYFQGNRYLHADELIFRAPEGKINSVLLQQVILVIW